jgi:hypothetical protein
MTAYGYDAVSAGMLARASARVRGYTGQNITTGTSIVTLAGSSPWLLPQRPVTSVTSLLDADGNDVEYTLSGPWVFADACGPLTVEFSHGYAVLPDNLLELVCAIAARMGGLPSAVAAGARTEQAGGEAVTWGVEAFNSSSGLTSSEEKSLRRLFPKRPRSWRLV